MLVFASASKVVTAAAAIAAEHKVTLVKVTLVRKYLVNMMITMKKIRFTSLSKLWKEGSIELSQKRGRRQTSTKIHSEVAGKRV